MPVWLSLVLRGARVGGLREMDSLHREANLMPSILPDSEAGQSADENTCQQLMKKYFDMPPAKRPNFKSLGIASPFSYPWKELLKEWNHSGSRISSYFVLRDRTALSKIDSAVKSFLSVNTDGDDCNCFGVEWDGNWKESALIGINVEVKGHGCISEHAIISLPTEQDLEVYFSDDRSKQRPSESVHEDSNRNKRARFKKKQCSLINSLKRKLKKYKLDKDTEKYDSIKKMIDEANTEKRTEMNRLWLPAICDTKIKDSADRKVMGMVISGGYSFTRGLSSGSALVPLSALCHLIRFHAEFLSNHSRVRLKHKYRLKPIVLVRVPSESVYSFATLNIHSNYSYRQ